MSQLPINHPQGGRGLFGRRKSPTFNAGMGQMPEVFDRASQADYGMSVQQEAAPQSFWQGGDKFTLRDGIAGALAAVGDGLSNWSGSGGGAVNNLMQSRVAPAMQAAALAAEQRKRAQDMADYQAKHDYRVANPIPETPEPRMVTLPDGRAVFGTMEEIMQLYGQEQAPPERVSRPEGMTDGDLYTRAREAIKNGADPAAVKQRLIDMGVRAPATL